MPGQRQLMYVHEQQLERIIADQGRAVLACLQNPPPADSATTNGINGSDSNMLFTTTPKLLSPARGSWAVSARVGGVQRLPGSSRALVRLLVTDRVAVQVGVLTSKIGWQPGVSQGVSVSQRMRQGQLETHAPGNCL